MNAPFRFDIVGSFLRPEQIKTARKNYSLGKITAEELKEVEDECIKQLIEKQKSSSLKVITDGEFRRSYWHLDYMWGFNGIEHIELDHGYYFHGEETTHGSIKVTDSISGENHPFVEHFKFVKQFEDENVVARQTIPAPAQLYAELYRESNGMNTSKVYPDDNLLIRDIAAAYRTVIKDLYDAGCRNIQFDDCTWGMLCDAKYQKFLADNGISFKAEQEKYLYLNNLALEFKPKDLVITTHVCRGNYHSAYASEGAYDPIAETLFSGENVDAYYLEYDDERSGSFEALKYVSPDKKVVLGLITTKSPVLENKEQVIARIRQAQQYVKLENLCLSPQCGFASCEIGNKLSEEQQWAKIKLVKEIADEVWGG